MVFRRKTLGVFGEPNSKTTKSTYSYEWMINQERNEMVSVKSVRRIGAASLLVPSLDHLISPSLTIMFAPVIMQTMFGLGWVTATIFFISLGIFQLIWIGVLLKSNNLSLLILGIVGNLVSILIYFVSTSGVTIFGVPPQPLIPFGVFIKALEIVFVLASLFIFRTNVRSSGGTR